MSKIRSGPPVPRKDLIDKGVPSWIALLLSHPQSARTFLDHFDEAILKKMQALRRVENWEAHLKLTGEIEALERVVREVRQYDQERRAQDGIELS